MLGLMGAGGRLDKGKFLGFRIISRPISGNNNISFFKDNVYERRVLSGCRWACLSF